MFDEYDPDKPQPKSPSGNPQMIGGIDISKAKRVKIGRTKPYTVDDPRYPEKMEKHKKAGVIFKLCPECKQMGLHDATRLDQLHEGGMIQGEVCDVCGYEDTHEWLG